MSGSMEMEQLSPTPEQSEPDLIRNNKKTIRSFRCLGLFLIYWKDGKYEASQARLLLFYFLWYLGSVAIFGVAITLMLLFREADYVDKVNDFIEAAGVVIMLGVFPSFGIYLLREYSIHLPQIMLLTSKFENTDFYKEVKTPEFLNNSKLKYKEGFMNDDHNDKEDEINMETGFVNSDKKMWWLVRRGPLVGLVLSLLGCAGCIIASIFVDVSHDDELKHVKHDAHYFILTLFYPIKAIVSLWFCIFFLEYQRKIYSSIRKFIRRTKNTSEKSTKNELEQVIDSVKIVQKVFILLNKKIFQKTIGIDFTLFIFLGVFCSCKIIMDSTNFVYSIPLAVIFIHLYLVCKWSNDLMSEFNETIEVLNEMPDDDVDNLRTVLNKYPPQVMAFGGFSVNYGMMNAMIAFILSLISISGMIWPEELDGCYQYLDINGVNKTLCIHDKISEELFANGELSLKLLPQNAEFVGHI